MKIFLAVFTLLFQTAHSYAEVKTDSNDGTYLSCSGNLDDGSRVEFEIRATAVPTFIQGILTDSASRSAIESFKCVRETEDEASSQGQILWECSEYAHIDDGDLSIEVARGGPTGVVTAQVKKKQIFPLPSAPIGTLGCSKKI